MKYLKEVLSDFLRKVFKDQHVLWVQKCLYMDILMIWMGCYKVCWVIVIILFRIEFIKCASVVIVFGWKKIVLLMLHCYYFISEKWSENFCWIIFWDCWLHFRIERCFLFCKCIIELKVSFFWSFVLEIVNSFKLLDRANVVLLCSSYMYNCDIVCDLHLVY